MSSCEIYEIFKNTFVYRTPPVDASELHSIMLKNVKIGCIAVLLKTTTQKELLSKNEITKSLVETQTAVLDSISNATSNKQATTPSALPNLRENYSPQEQLTQQQEVEEQQK